MMYINNIHILGADRLLQMWKTKRTLFRGEGIVFSSWRKLRLWDTPIFNFVTLDIHSTLTEGYSFNPMWPRRKSLDGLALVLGAQLESNPQQFAQWCGRKEAIVTFFFLLNSLLLPSSLLHFLSPHKNVLRAEF